MRLRGKPKPRQYREFLILNWDQANARDPSAVTNLDEAMAGAGAIPVGGLDSPQGVIYRVELMRNDLDPQELLEIFEGLGFQVEVPAEDKRGS
jgi:hypothetical protein